ncbi:ricin-type beta-trefoil lectin domain protein [Streptomyces chiangmaiensis]|uniref:Ricin-type beta-trefoil lectin domain protein n=1 Tax=Streptomyces chiangmaiensis TaxID=766497 RepID=A0ABU7FFM5_9ACTN|nr:ricin-type beta-trefoil lectin domain protein [Streptomyces chiangmaiensis]MED7822941.1 ricin-type beta-trefoil lectin domain protein [Streptomyces chiangmaiensis]
MRIRHLSPLVGFLASVSLLSAAPDAQAAANPGPGFPAQYVAPWVETWNSPSAMANAQAATGVKHFHLAFVLSDGTCNATFNGNVSINDAGWSTAINNLRASGGDVIASFGGAAGTELAQACGSVSALQAQYQRVIDALNLTRLDFDIEGAPLKDTAANDRRNQALANLQAAAAAAGRKLDIDYTLPTNPDGLDGDGLSLVNNAKSRNVNVNLVNIMTMDYYQNVSDMGAAAVSAANALHTQLANIWTTKTSDELWAMEGNTPMIGVNDSRNEIFTTGNATTLTNFAKSKGIQQIGYWALGRDKACATNGTLSDSCSGTPQSPYQFAGIFNGISDDGGGGTTHTGRITGYAGLCLDDRAASTANGNPIQVYTCNGTNAQNWTVNDADHTLQVLGKCLDVPGGGTANGIKVQLYDCNGTGAQVWVPQANGSLLNPQSGKCLDDTDWSTTPGTQSQIWSCSGNANQKWNLPA